MNFEQNVRRLAEERLCELREEGKVTGLTIVRRSGTELLLIGIAAETDVQAPGYDRAAVEAIRERLSEALDGLPFRILGEPVAPQGSYEPGHGGIPAAVPGGQGSQSEQQAPAGGLNQQNLSERLSRLERHVAELPSSSLLVLATTAALGTSIASLVVLTAWLVFPSEVRELLRRTVALIAPN